MYGSKGIQKALREAFGNDHLTSSVTETEDYCKAIQILRVAVTTGDKENWHLHNLRRDGWWNREWV